MAITFRNYQPEPLFGDDYYKLRTFLLKRNSTNFPFGRWDWMITHSYLEKENLSKIGIWEENDEVVAVATYDVILGSAYILMKDKASYLNEEVFLYAERQLAKDGKTKILLPDDNQALAEIAAKHGFCATSEREFDSIYPINIDNIHYTLPEGFRITSMKEDFDLYKYGKVLWNGFNHELNGEGPYQMKYDEEGLGEFKRPYVNLDLKVAVVAPDGNFVSYCGMWQDNASEYALVEPVATDPAYRRMGLGKAAVLEAVKRCGELGAKYALVSSAQQFYYNIGFRPFRTSTMWIKKERGF